MILLNNRMQRKRVLLLTDSARPSGRGLLRGVGRYSHLHGNFIFYRKPLFYVERCSDEIPLSRLKRWNPDGIIMQETRQTEEIISLGIPTVVSPHSRREFCGASNITSNSAGIGKMAAEHLLERGFKNFAYCGFDEHFWSVERAEGFSKRLSENGFDAFVYISGTGRGSHYWENEQKIVAEWLKSLPKPVGLMACNDDRSQEVAEACKLAGLYVPEQVAIVGVDNDDLICSISDPPLSSVEMNIERSGYQAAELLDKMMSGRKIKYGTITIEPTHVEIRQSTDILAIPDGDVAEAVRFIWQNAAVRMILIDDVVDTVNVGRRGLEQRFQKVLGRSIGDEIRRIRCEHIAKLLAETDLTVSQIASNFGHNTDKHISRTFKKYMGMSPAAYRKKCWRK